MKSLGIIGGTGPGSSAQLYLRIIKALHARGVSQRPRILLDSIPLPMSVERDLLLEGKDEGFIPFLQESARLLEDAGVDTIVLASNTLHVHEDVIRNALGKATFLSLSEAVPTFLEKHGIKRVGLLGTSITTKKVHKEPLKRRGIEQIVPDSKLQSNLDATIQRVVTDQWNERDQQCVRKAVKQLEDANVDTILLACTDLTVLDIESTIPLLDTVDVLADITATELLRDV